MSIADLEKQIQIVKNKSTKSSEQNDEDPLDSFMINLNKPQLDKQQFSKIKLELAQLKKEHASVIRLMTIAKPANIPYLLPETTKEPPNKPKPVFPIVGKRLKTKLQLPQKPDNKHLATSSYAGAEEVEEEDEDGHDFDKDKNTRTDQIKAIRDSSGHTNNIPRKIEASSICKSKDQEEISTNPADSLVETLKRSSKPSNNKRKKESEEKMKGYEGENLGKDYSMWVPPSNQSGDGRTSLNDKLGY